MTFAIVSGIMFLHWRYISIPEGFLSGVYTDSQQCHWCVFSALDTHIWCVTHILLHFAQRSLSERMHVCHCCVLSLPTLLFCHSLYHSFRFFINLHSTFHTNGQKTGFYCLALRFHNYTFSQLATELHWNVCVWTKYRTAVPQKWLLAHRSGTHECPCNAWSSLLDFGFLPYIFYWVQVRTYWQKR